jgi:hypothetical protein
MSRNLRILVVGAGQIGSRHIQALASIPNIIEVVAVDPSTESCNRARQRWHEISGHANKFLSFFSTLNEVNGRSFDLAVLATNATKRLDYLNQVAALGIRNVLAEKLLFQSVDQLEKAIELCSNKHVALYPNYVYRYTSPWSQLREYIRGQNFEMRIDAGDIGFATNLPHWLDLFEFLADSPLSELSIKLSCEPYPSKRDRNLIDFSGRAFGKSLSGSSLSMSFEEGLGLPVATISTVDGNIILNEEKCTISGSLRKSDMKLDTPLVSKTTSLIVTDILFGKTALPNLIETASMNRLLLNAIQLALYRTIRTDKIIPIT